MSWAVLEGDCIDALAGLAEASVDAVVCDPPYGLEFMGKEWDALGKSGVQRQAEGGGGDRRAIVDADEWAGGESSPYSRSRVRWQHGNAGPGAMQAWHHAWALEALRVLKPGGHLLAFGGTRTYHRLACAIEDAGFEIRDTICWLYGSGFPKSLDVSKAIDKAAGAEREVVGKYVMPADSTAPGYAPSQGLGYGSTSEEGRGRPITEAATPEAEQWQGWGTALKPAHEPIVVARKPLVGTVAANVLEHGTGALNIDGCRIEGDAGNRPPAGFGSERTYAQDEWTRNAQKPAYTTPPAGRWPANVVLDEEAAGMLDEQSGELTSGTAVGGLHRRSNKDANCYGHYRGERTEGDVTYGDRGGASRFFYCAKASRAERGAENNHPTVKPIALMRWLVRLVTPRGGLVLDPFAGSGTTGCAAALEGFDFLGIEREAEYVALANARIAHREPKQLSLEAA